MNDTPPPVHIETARKSLISRISYVWVVPFLALVIALGVAWQSYHERGPLIEITFVNGAGIKAGETELRYRDITVGTVESVRFSKGLTAVIASLRLDKAVAPYVDAQSIFWVVRPELSARGVTGLDTVLTGVYIEGSWDSKIGAPKRNFEGLLASPLIHDGKEGLKIKFRAAPGGNLTDDSPIYFRGIEVGQVGKAKISEQGSFVVADAVIYHPHDRLISPSTRFWDTSGFTFSVGPTGAEIDFSSFAALVSGGVAFDTFVSGGGPAVEGAEFEVYADDSKARNSLFTPTEVAALEMRVVFDENISGLAVGEAVELSGLKIGEVKSISGVIDPKEFGDSRVRLNAILDLQPAQLGLPGTVTPEAALDFLVKRIGEGLRARLASAGLLGGLKIELVQVDNLPKAVVQTGPGLIPIIPHTASKITDAGGTIETVINRVNKLPIEALLNSAITFLHSADSLISNKDLNETPQELLALLGDVRGVVGSEDVKEIPSALNGILDSFEKLLAQLEKEQIAAKLATAVTAAASAAEGVKTSVAGVPELLKRIDAVAAKVETLPLTDLIDQLTALTASADKVIGTEAAQKLPADLGAALSEINSTLLELREGGAINNINAALGSARKAADSISASAQDLPSIVARVGTLLNQASVTISGYNKGDVLSRDAESALRDISKAAEAIASFARFLERNPGALIRGR